MQFNKKFYGLALATVAGGMLMSCSNELNEPIGNETLTSAIRLVKAPEVYAYSGTTAFGTPHSLPMAYGNAGNGDLGNQTWNGFGAADLKNIEDDERRGVLAAIAEKVTGQQMSEDIVFYYENYFLQDVVSGVNGNFPGAGSSGTSSSSYTMEAYSKGSVCDPYDWEKHDGGKWVWNPQTNQNDYLTNPNYETERQNYTEVANSGHISNIYVHENPDKSQTQIKETALMTDMHLGTYEEMKGRQFRWFINCHEDLHWSEYIVVKYDGNYYICFDFGCGHEEHQNEDGHPGRGCEVNDWDYNDWVLKITTAGQGEILGERSVEQPDPTPDPTPGEGDGGNNEDLWTKIPEHVEVNLSIEERLSYLTSHLSIHVRAATDVEVFIPIPASYVCEADDLDIVEKHRDDLMVHGGPTTVTYTINGETVTLTVKTEADGIRVTTDGINENVISYLKDKHNDGITFEIWNYFNIKHSDWVDLTHDYLDLDALKGMMNQSTVKFLDKTPELYVNAFMWETGDAEFHEGHEGIFCDDCTVRPYDDNLYDTQETNYFYNNSPYNELYYNSGAK